MDLFDSLLNDETPENILTDVTNSFDYFLQKTITSLWLCKTDLSVVLMVV